MADSSTLIIFVGILGGISLTAMLARRLLPNRGLPSLEDWALARRGLGTLTTWSLLGGSIFTAYTFAAVPGFAYGVGALGFFAVPYTIILCPILFVVLPRLRKRAALGQHVTVADYVGARYHSPGLALAIALTAIVATMPYLALQILGIRAVLRTVGIYPAGLPGDLVLVIVFAILAAATYQHGLRAPTVISWFKAALVFGAAGGITAAALYKLGGTAAIFEHAEREQHIVSPGASLSLDPSTYTAYASLALGSAFALPMYPHVLTATFAAAGEKSLRRAAIAMPAWTAVLALFGFLGIAAVAAGIQAPPGAAETALPLLVVELIPGWLAGVVFGALAVGALVPAAVMSLAVATLFVRNIYVVYFFPTATPKHELRIARGVSLLAKLAALAFVFCLRDQDAINLQLLGGVWILQIFPTVVMGEFCQRLRRGALLAGWTIGVVAGTVLVVAQGFTSVIDFGTGAWPIKLYAAVVALVLNLAVVSAVTVFTTSPANVVQPEPRQAEG